MAVIAIGVGIQRMSSPGNTMQQNGSTVLIPAILSIVLVLWMGLRPVSTAFGDTVVYAHIYNFLDSRTVSVDWDNEWIWALLMNSSKAAGFSLNIFFTIVEAGYILSAFWAVKRFMPSNPMLGMLFLLNSLMFFTFGVNGLRNGLACHLVLLGTSFLYDDKWVPGAVMFLLAFGIHRSIMLPIAAILFGLFVNRNVRYAIIFWLASIVVSLIAGGAVTNFFEGLGFDDRMTQYSTYSDMSEFSHSGFRWDFLLYSAMPIVMAWYVCIKKGMQDNWYNAICMAYCLANAFWVMVIRAAFSNRFAYLSWFLYPIVIAYPLVNMDFRNDMDRFTGIILIAYACFSLFMWFIFW